ncbi:MAG: hypothetical protein RL172_1845, partial [Bacteroidota bacterium]
AMACGLPVAVSEKAGAAGNLVNEGVNGIIIRSNEQDKLAALLLKAAADKSLLPQMGSQGTSIIHNYTFKHIQTAIEKYMQQL